MARMGLVPERIEAVLLTHFHSDHIGGLGTVALARWVSNAARSPLRVIGPPASNAWWPPQRGVRAGQWLPHRSSWRGGGAALWRGHGG